MPRIRRLWEPIGTGDAAGITAYALRGGKPLLLDEVDYRTARRERCHQVSGGTGRGRGGLARRAAAVRGSDPRHRRRPGLRADHLSEADKDLLVFVGQHIATALSRARAIEETRERNAELAVINEIGSALAQQLDFQGIVELVGEKVREIFEVDTMAVVIYDEAIGSLDFPFSLDEGVRYQMPPIKLGEGLTSQVIQSKQPLLFGTGTEADAEGAISYGTPTEAWLGVPILAGERVIGTINLESIKKNAFSDSDVRLLSTVASNMGVALENARLFDETKRLLAETDQRAAELALVNEIGSALAKQLDFDGHHRARRRPALGRSSQPRLGTCSSPCYDQVTRLISSRSRSRRASGSRREPIELGAGPDVDRHQREPTAPLRERSRSRSRRARSRERGESTHESWLGVPIRAGGEVIGVDRPRPRPAGRIQRGRRAARLDGRLEHGRGPRQRPPVRRDEAASRPKPTSAPPSSP